MSIINKFLGWATADQLTLNDGSNNPSVQKQFRVTLTAAQVKALFTTPQTLIAAPGAGKYLTLDEIFGYVSFGTVAFTGANAVEVRYTNGSGAKVSGDLAAAWLNSSANTAVKGIAAAVTPVANAGIVVAVPTANPGAGDSTVTFEGTYRIVTLP
jgi:hypothetical protein